MSDVASSLSIGQVAERTGLSVHALRFYEREGILANSVHRGPGGRRAYTEDDVDWLHHCMILRGSGMPIPVIRKYIELIREGEGDVNVRERVGLLLEHQDRVRKQISRLTECLDLIKFKLAVYEDHLDQAAGK